MSLNYQNQTRAFHGRHAPQCTYYSIRPLYPRDSGETTTSTLPHSCAPPLLVTIKGGGGLPLDGTPRRLKTRSIITYALASLFATFNPSSSRDLGAFLPLSPRLYPYYKHIGCKIIQCLHTPPMLDVRSRSRNQDKSCVTVLSLASSFGTRKHAAFTS